MKKLFAALLVLLLAGNAAAETYVENGGRIPDGNTYGGSPEQAYAQILNSHASAIQTYEARSIEYRQGGTHVVSQCRPVGFEDLNADGVPELIFMEAVYGEDQEARGDLYIYSWRNGSAGCTLYVPGITRPDYDDFLGFDIYLSSLGGNSLVIEHYEYECPWILQFSADASGQYDLNSYLHWEYWSNNGEQDVRYLANGTAVSADEYSLRLDSLRNAKTRTVSGYMETGAATYGFDYTWSGAMEKLQQEGTWGRANNKTT